MNFLSIDNSLINSFCKIPLFIMSSLRMLRYVTVQGGLGLLAVKRACLLSRLAHSGPQNNYRPIKKVMVANRGENLTHTVCVCACVFCINPSCKMTTGGAAVIVTSGSASFQLLLDVMLHRCLYFSVARYEGKKKISVQVLWCLKEVCLMPLVFG